MFTGGAKKIKETCQCHVSFAFWQINPADAAVPTEGDRLLQAATRPVGHGVSLAVPFVQGVSEWVQFAAESPHAPTIWAVFNALLVFVSGFQINVTGRAFHVLLVLKGLSCLRSLRGFE